MKVREVMSKDVVVANSDETISDAARMMAEHDIGALPVGDDGRLLGVITDRDIAIRAVARRLAPDTPVREVMSEKVLYCYDDEDLEHVAKNMGDNQVRRLPVVNRDKRLVGIVSLADVSRSVERSTVGEAVAEISQPSGKRSQSPQVH